MRIDVPSMSEALPNAERLYFEVLAVRWLSGRKRRFAKPL